MDQLESSDQLQDSDQLEDGDHDADDARPGSASAQKEALLLFQPSGRPDGIAAKLRARGIVAEEFDVRNGPEQDLLCNTAFNRLLTNARAGRYSVCWIAVPCESWSVARLDACVAPTASEPVADASSRKRRKAPRPLRDRTHPEGFPWLRGFERREVEAANELARRACDIAWCVFLGGGGFAFEHPIDRGDRGSVHFREMWRNHAPIWIMPAMRELMDATGAAIAEFPQCAHGSEAQKWTAVLRTADLCEPLRALTEVGCAHAKHSKVAVGLDADGHTRSQPTAAYPAQMCATAARGLATRHAELTQRRPLFVGSAKPHASSSAEAQGAAPPVAAASTASIRTLEPELEEVLRLEPMPDANRIEQATEWEEPLDGASRHALESGAELVGAAAGGPVPPPLTTKELFPPEMLRKVVVFLASIKAVWGAAGRGAWALARSLRPEPVEASEDEAVMPAGRGWTWERREDGLWHALELSRYPDRKPDADIDLDRIVAYAREHGFPDMQLISWVAHGLPGPARPRHVLLAPPHVGALKEAIEFKRLVQKDADRGWAISGHALPCVWPCTVEPNNIAVSRAGKCRLTVDKSVELVDGQLHPSSNNVARNDPLLRGVKVKMVNVRQFGRGAAILLTAGLPVRQFGKDLEAYFKKTGTQQADRWQSGLAHQSGFGAHVRVQFGAAEAPDLLGRESIFIVWVARRELRRLDALYPPRDAGAVEWLASRHALWQEAGGGEKDAYRYAVTFFLLQYVDDLGCCIWDDALFNAQGEPVRVAGSDGALVQQRRPEMYDMAVKAVIEHFGHTEAVGKGVPPGDTQTLLGVFVDLRDRCLSMPKEKRESYATQAETLLGSDTVVARDELSSLMHKLVHAASCIVLGRQHLYHVRKVASAASHRVALSSGARTELAWWAFQLRREDQLAVPLASRSDFPLSGAHGLLEPYSDASREESRPEESGFGAWCVFGGTFWYVHGRWSADECRLLSINVLELFAMQLGTLTFIDKARELGLHVSHVREFTDNRAAELSAERGRPHTERMSLLIRERYEHLVEMKITPSAARIATEDNDIADGLSRGGELFVDALRIAAASGLPLQHLRIDAGRRCSEELCKAQQPK